MLVVLMSNLAGAPAGHLRNKNSIVIDQAQLTVLDDDVAVLQVAVRNTRSLQRMQQAQPLFRKVQQHVLAMEHFAHVKIQRRALDPIHEENRKPVATDQYSFRSVTKLRKI